MPICVNFAFRRKTRFLKPFSRPRRSRWMGMWPVRVRGVSLCRVSPVSWRTRGAVWRTKSRQKSKKWHAKIHAFFGMRKKREKTRKKGSGRYPPAECAVPAGGKEGSKPSGVCETFCTTLHAISLHANNHAIKVRYTYGFQVVS